MKNIIFVNAIFLHTFVHLGFTSKPQVSSKTIIVDGISPCPSQKRLPTKLSTFSFYNKHGETIINVSAEFTETLKAPLEIKVEGERCDIQRVQCTSIPGINYDRFCSVFNESYYGKTYFGKAQPPIKSCPIKKGTYVLTNAVIDHESILKTVPFPIGRYKFKNIIFDKKNGKKRAVMCWICEYRVQISSKRYNN